MLMLIGLKKYYRSFGLKIGTDIPNNISPPLNLDWYLPPLTPSWMKKDGIELNWMDGQPGKSCNTFQETCVPCYATQHCYL